MPYSFTKIEKDKSQTIAFVFSFLILFYFATIWVVCLFVKNYGVFQTRYGANKDFIPLDLFESLIIFGVALVVGVGHWFYSTNNIIPKIIRILGAEEANPKDSYHQMFINVVEEVSIATGGVKIIPAVVPTMAMNAFALADFEGRSMIGVTEGLLGRLTREQLEAVVGHEAAHIVSGDCLTTTVTSSLFELHGGMLKGMELMLGGGRYSYRTRRREGGSAYAFVLIIYLFLMLTNFLAQLARMFISREREYRADAIAARLTRNPLALAEALYAIGFHWRGAGLSAQELEAIFIMNPRYAASDESEGIGEDLFSTHPPMIKRIDVLLDMAHSDFESLQNDVANKANKPRMSVPGLEHGDDQWMVQKDGQWQGPFALSEFLTLGWIRPDTWIKRLYSDDIIMARDDQTIAKALAGDSKGSASQGECPKCHVPLKTLDYEGCEVLKCGFCQGTLVKETDVQRIIIRQDVGFNDRIKRMAEGILNEKTLVDYNRIPKDPRLLLDCPNCIDQKRKMIRRFYTMAYRVEVDRCMNCQFIWFEKDELEILQYLIEKKVDPQV